MNLTQHIRHKETQIFTIFVPVLRTFRAVPSGGQGGQLPPLGKLNVDFFNEVFVFDGIFLVAILVQNLKKTG